jgi:hypothetical protein
MSPRPSPIVNHVYEMNFNYVCYRRVSQVNISWWAYVIIRPESLSVEAQEPDFVHVSMHITNENINTAACRPTTMNE